MNMCVVLKATTNKTIAGRTTFGLDHVCGLGNITMACSSNWNSNVAAHAVFGWMDGWIHG